MDLPGPSHAGRPGLVNLYGVIHGVRAFVPLMIEHRAGTRLVWIVEPANRTVHVYRAPHELQAFGRRLRTLLRPSRAGAGPARAGAAPSAYTLVMRRFIGCCVLAAAAAAVCLAEGEAEAARELTSYELAGTGHALDHPAGWTATRETMYDGGRLTNVLTVITELPQDQDLGLAPSGYRLVVDHLQVSRFAHAIRPEQQYQSLLEFYIWFYDWPEPGEVELIELFDRHAVQMKARNADGSWQCAALGVGVFRELHRIGYAIVLTAPASKPAWERDRLWAAIIGSVRRITAVTASNPAP